MSEQEEDINAFDSWDNFGASMLLAIMPAVLNFVFNGKDLLSTALLAGIGALISIGILLLSLITQWRIIGILVNLAGNILVPVYIAVALYCWWG